MRSDASRKMVPTRGKQVLREQPREGGWELFKNRDTKDRKGLCGDGVSGSLRQCWWEYKLM